MCVFFLRACSDMSKGVDVLACDALATATANGGGCFTFGDLLHACVKLAEVFLKKVWGGGIDRSCERTKNSGEICHNPHVRFLNPLLNILKGLKIKKMAKGRV